MVVSSIDRLSLFDRVRVSVQIIVYYFCDFLNFVVGKLSSLQVGQSAT